MSSTPHCTVLLPRKFNCMMPEQWAIYSGSFITTAVTIFPYLTNKQSYKVTNIDTVNRGDQIQCLTSYRRSNELQQGITTMIANKSQKDTYSGLMPHKVRSSHDELNAADICKPLCTVETGMKVGGPSHATAPLTPVCSLQQLKSNEQHPAAATASDATAIIKQVALLSQRGYVMLRAFL